LDKLDELYSNLDQIGFRVTHGPVRKIVTPDIERTLIQACYYIDDDGRLLGLILSWLKIHGSHVIADKFLKEYEQAKKYLGETPWVSGLCAYMESLKDHRFKKGIKGLKVHHHLGNTDQSTLVSIKGSEKVFENVGIIVPQSAIRIRAKDIVNPEDLIKSNLQYRNRYAFGANWRAEIITSIQNGANSPAQVARMLGIAKSRVGIVFKEYMQVREFI
jgi:hypothetical protein